MRFIDSTTSFLDWCSVVEEEPNPYQAPSLRSSPTGSDGYTETEGQALESWFRFCGYLVVGGFAILIVSYYLSLTGAFVRFGFQESLISMFNLLGGGMLAMGMALMLFGIFAIALQAMFGR